MEKNTAQKIDETDLDIVRLLWDGRTPYSEIAAKLGLATNSVRNRVNQMIENGVLQIIGLINPEAIEGHHAAYIGIKLLPQKIKSAHKEINALRGVVAATQVSGRFDIIALVMFNKTYTFRHFYEEHLSKVDGLLSSETFFAVPGDGFQLRYVL